MKIDIQFGRPRDHNEQDKTYLATFTIVGGTRISDIELIKAGQTSGGMRKIEQQILAELSALIQVELYGRVLSNEQTPNKGTEDRRLLSSVQTDPSGGESQKSGG